MKKYHIGIDLDNTIICYDDVFYLAFKQITKKNTASVEKNKLSVRSYLRQQPNGEKKWQAVQRLVYEQLIHQANAFSGALNFINTAHNQQKSCCIISHKDRAILRKVALVWLKNNGFLHYINPQDIYFANNRTEKIQLIKTAECQHFIDDLPEVLFDKQFPQTTQPHHFSPQQP